MATYNKFNAFTQKLLDGVFNFGTDTVKVMLTNSAPVATNAVKADITEIGAGNGYTAGGTASAVTVAQVSGTQWKVTGAAVTFTATGAVGPFQYCVFYDSTVVGGPLIGWFDYGSAVTLANTQTFTVTPDQSNGLFSVT